MIKHINIQVWGKVQGVFFRNNIKKKAESLNLKGYAKNKDDGSVFIELEGDDLYLGLMFDYIKLAPGASKPTNIKYNYSKELQNFQDFEIK